MGGRAHARKAPTRVRGRPRQEYGVETRGRLTIGNNVSN